MTMNQAAQRFTLSVEFAGICLYVIDDTIEGDKREREVAVLMPTCVPTPDGRAGGRHHEDETDGARHVPYLMMDLANIVPGVTTPGLLADGPKFQVVRRLRREELFFEPQEPIGPVIRLVPDPLPLPNLTVYNDRIRLRGDPLAAIRPNDRLELNVRTILRGGTLEATTIGGAGVGQRRGGWDQNPADWAGSIRWTRENIPGNSLTIRILNWDNQQSTPLTLRPVTLGGRDVIELKIAILCETNPLEWREFAARFVRDDRDFKWLYRLFEARNGGGLNAVRGRGREFPFPMVTQRHPRTTGNTGCTGGQFQIP